MHKRVGHYPHWDKNMATALSQSRVYMAIPENNLDKKMEQKNAENQMDLGGISFSDKPIYMHVI
jgi:hypothetical protein